MKFSDEILRILRSDGLFEADLVSLLYINFSCENVLYTFFQIYKNNFSKRFPKTALDVTKTILLTKLRQTVTIVSHVFFL